MAKKLTLLAMAVAALAALVVPATASAVQLTEEGVPASGTIIGTSTNAKTTNLPEGLGGGSLTCEKIATKGTIEENGPETVKGSGSSGTFTNCVQTDEAGKKHEITVTSPGFSLSTTEANMGTGSIELTFIVDLPNIKAECHFVSHVGTLTYETGSDTLHVASVRLTATQELCENEEGGGIKFEGDFTLETEDGTPVTATE